MTRGHYTTKQQKEILTCLQGLDGFVTVDTVYERLLAQGIKVGRATVYRFMERLEEEGLVVKCKASDNQRTEYRYLPNHTPEEHEHCDDDSAGKMCCTLCGKTVLLHCMQLEGFSRHIFNEHGFIIEPQKTVLYGRCEACSKIGKGGQNK